MVRGIRFSRPPTSSKIMNSVENDFDTIWEALRPPPPPPPRAQSIKDSTVMLMMM